MVSMAAEMTTEPEYATPAQKTMSPALLQIIERTSQKFRAPDELTYDEIIQEVRALTVSFYRTTDRALQIEILERRRALEKQVAHFFGLSPFGCGS